jgi:hypothetical protein
MQYFGIIRRCIVMDEGPWNSWFWIYDEEEGE